MEKKDKDLLLKDLSARLPYGVKVFNNSFGGVDAFNLVGCDGEELIDDERYWYMIEDYKPYLFPLSSMTEEQKRELKDLLSQETKILIEHFKNYNYCIDEGKYHFIKDLELDWLLKNHFDFRGLIPKNIAKDATGLNIY